MSPDPKTIVIISCIFLIFAGALLVPHIVRTYRDRHRDIDEMLDEVLGEEHSVIY